MAQVRRTGPVWSRPYTHVRTLLLLLRELAALASLVMLLPSPQAWAALASEMPSVLVKFLNALGIEEPSAAGSAGVILVPVREGVEVLTCGSQVCEAEVQTQGLYICWTYICNIAEAIDLT